MKASIVIFILAVLAVGSVVAHENSASGSPTATTAESGFNLDYGGDQMDKAAIDQRIIDQLGLFDRSDDGGSGRYNVAIDLENEDSDWSFEVAVTTEF